MPAQPSLCPNAAAQEPSVGQQKKIKKQNGVSETTPKAHIGVTAQMPFVGPLIIPHLLSWQSSHCFS